VASRAPAPIPKQTEHPRVHEVSGARDAVEWSGASFDCNIGQVVDGPGARSQGALAQLVARFHGMEEVRGSSPLSSTNFEQLFY
jgi:hypothetical protein